MNTRTVKMSQTETVDFVQPGDLNVHRTLFGGKLLSMIDKTGGLAAYKHARIPVVTLSLDRVVFHKAIPMGSIVTVKACVNRVFKSSLEVGVAVYKLEHDEPDEQKKVCTAYLTFVGVDKEGNTLELPPIHPESEDEKRRFEQAAKRREVRFALDKEFGNI